MQSRKIIKKLFYNDFVVEDFFYEYYLYITRNYSL